MRDLGINQAGFAGAIASLEDENHVKKYKELVDEGREFYHNQFNAMGLEYIPGETPFLMVKLNMPSKVVQRRLMAKNVFVRKGDDWYMPGYLRISIGFPEENRACVTAFKEIMKHRSPS